MQVFVESAQNPHLEGGKKENLDDSKIQTDHMCVCGGGGKTKWIKSI